MARPCSFHNDLTSASSATSRRGLVLADGITSLSSAAPIRCLFGTGPPHRKRVRRLAEGDIEERTAPRLLEIRPGRPAGSKILGVWHTGVNRPCHRVVWMAGPDPAGRWKERQP